MSDVLVFALLFTAIAIGWYLGRRSATVQPAGSEHTSQYYKGLNYLLDAQPDGIAQDDIDTYIGNLELNSETLEAHITIGNMLRKRGEVDRAIRIHQYVLKGTDLPPAQVHEAHLELARDYVAAGLLDRAEQLLVDLVQESPRQRRASQRHLQEIYQSERDWPKAIAVALALLPGKDTQASSREVVTRQRLRIVLSMEEGASDISFKK